MSKLIQKAGFLNPKRAGRYMNYIATRDGVELLDENADSIYMRYIATRPRAEKHGEHGLFGAEDAVELIPEDFLHLFFKVRGFLFY